MQLVSAGPGPPSVWGSAIPGTVCPQPGALIDQPVGSRRKNSP